MNATRYLHRGDGRLAYDDTGAGPLVVCIPGVGDVRAEYRRLEPQLREAGFRVVTLDLRGHGESDATFTDHERATVGDDVIALLEHLDDGPAHLIGASFGAAAAVWAAARAAQRVASITLIGPFVRDVPVPAIQRIGLRALLARPWGPRAWAWWYRSLYKATKPTDLDAYARGLRDNLAEPGRLEALRAMAAADCRDIDPLLDNIAVPATVIMGGADPDFPDPAAEADTVAVRLRGNAVVVDGAGHYPHAETPEVTGPAIVDFLSSVTATPEPA